MGTNFSNAMPRNLLCFGSSFSWNTVFARMFSTSCRTSCGGCMSRCGGPRTPGISRPTPGQVIASKSYSCLESDNHPSYIASTMVLLGRVTPYCNHSAHITKPGSGSSYQCKWVRHRNRSPPTPRLNASNPRRQWPNIRRCRPSRWPSYRRPSRTRAGSSSICYPLPSGVIATARLSVSASNLTKNRAGHGKRSSASYRRRYGRRNNSGKFFRLNYTPGRSHLRRRSYNGGSSWPCYPSGFWHRLSISAHSTRPCRY